MIVRNEYKVTRGQRALMCSLGLNGGVAATACEGPECAMPSSTDEKERNGRGKEREDRKGKQSLLLIAAWQ